MADVAALFNQLAQKFTYSTFDKYSLFLHFVKGVKIEKKS